MLWVFAQFIFQERFRKYLH